MPATLFISDLHLAGERPAVSERFFEFLEAQAARAAALYVLGDLFEYWIGDDELDAAVGDPLARRVANALGELSRHGVAVAFMHGNRDFLVGGRFCEASGARLLDDPSVEKVGGVRTLLMHGDTLCTDDHDYQAWRRTARSREWQRGFLAKTLPERRAALQALRTHGLTRLVHGHTHRPARHALEVDGRRCERWVLPDWYERGGYLAIDDAGPRLVSF